MKKAIYLYVTLCLLIILAGCGGWELPRELQAVSNIINQQPDSALALLDGLESDKAHWDKDAQMRYELLRLKALNKLYIDFTNDSLPRVLVDYFDSHGTRNDRVLARYMLGRAYHAMGDAPMALETYYDAISLADTLSPDCDLDALSGVYGQMSQIFHRQNLPYDELLALKQHIRITALICSEEEAIAAKGQLIRPYFLMDSLDLYLQTINDCYNEYMRIGNRKRAAETVGPAVPIYVWRGQLDKARELTDIYERESGLFDEQGNIAAGRESYYYCKGIYLLAIHEIDSAEYYYRKAIRYGYLSEGYKGLLQVYRVKRNSDSIAHYSLLFEAAQDSLHNQMRTESIHQMSALYDYSRSQKQAEQEAEKARKARQAIWIIIALALMALFVMVHYYRRSQAKKRQEIRRLNEALSSARAEHQTVQSELSRLKAKDYEGLIAEKERREQELQQTIDALQAERHQPADRLDDLTDSQIAQLFRRKSEQKTERPIPSEAEWRLLEKQFSQDMPATFERFCCGRKLSTLELRTCVLLILGYPESTIVKMTEKSSQAITTAKTRANDKLFGQHEAHSLKSNLLRP